MAEFCKITNGVVTAIPSDQIDAAYRDSLLEEGVQLMRREADGTVYLWDPEATTAASTLPGGWVQSTPATNGLAPAHFLAKTLIVADP